VATTICTVLDNLYTSSLNAVPPVDTIHSTPKCLPISFTIEDTYNANSLVGTNNNPYIWSLDISNFSITGITKAAVLPVPFLALAIIDFPAKAKGIHSS